MSHSQLIAAIIRELDKCAWEQPDLESIAKRAGLSSSHFHRLFSAWAGITPKDFVQCLTFENVKRWLKEGKSVLNAALDSGLSGPGRLHDLCVQIEAASPGEIKSGGAGWTIKAGFAASPFGLCFIAESPRGICYLGFPPAKGQNEFARLRKDWPNAKIKRDDKNAAKLAAKIFKRGKSASKATLKTLVKGTPFQISVWRALIKVPAGELTSYGRLAEAVGKPQACRAVGSAVGDNPIAYLIPCHRVIRETGVIGNYYWGPVYKKAMLVWEGTRK